MDVLISLDRGINVKYTFEDLEEYLRNGGDPNSTGYGGTTILKQASMPGDSKTVELLLEYGADPNLGDTRNRVLRHWGNTPPLFVTNRNIYVTRLLLEGGADVNYITRKFGTPLHRAAERGYNGIVELLLEYGADPNIKTNVMDPTWNQERDRDPITGQRIAGSHAPQINVNPEELSILSGHLDTAEIIQGNIPTKQKLALSTSMIEQDIDTPLQHLDYDTMQKLMSYITYNPAITHRIRQEERRDQLIKSRQRLASMRSMHSREGPFGSIRYDPSLMEHVSGHLSRIGPYSSVQSRMMLEDRQRGSGNSKVKYGRKGKRTKKRLYR